MPSLRKITEEEVKAAEIVAQNESHKMSKDEHELCYAVNLLKHESRYDAAEGKK